ncbi:hypothetical protein FE257_008246 [Aspergillus nanangensis]|uniref:RING-type domain-containing protein n=1 Tax=Aspergillus nanangensis TaxID=2582783 RepID=A0AAD4CLW1_ASPNN|nr:hypothetical protein FE257_008246 [Aspergillus nanangensis]
MVLSLSVPLFKDNNISSTTISEALRNNPFGIPSRARPIITRPTSPADRLREQQELNNALETLAYIFPDVKIEVFRELLLRFDGNSRVHVCVDQLLRHKDEWVAGRWNLPTGGAKKGDEPPETKARDGDDDVVPRQERFRTDEYKSTVKLVLSKEFTGLSKSTVEAVLAEANFCYMDARPTLRDLSQRTWRATFNNILPSFRSRRERDQQQQPQHPLLAWDRQEGDALVPRLKPTGCDELDREVYEAVLAPLLRTQREMRERKDRQLAEELNTDEATAADALFECECCLADVTFEEIATCSDNMHMICYGCVRRTVHEALFGQGWNKSVDPERCTLKCLAPVSDDECPGILNAKVVRRAILLDKAGSETWGKFETRLASDVLMKSELKLIKCPFCAYAEVDSAHHPPEGGIPWRMRTRLEGNLLSTIRTLILLVYSSVFLVVILGIAQLIDPTAISSMLQQSLLNLCLKVRLKKFTCRNPLCGQASCINCLKAWRDPHICHEPLLLDLRATVEAARTAALKRTCPRCSLSFVKSDGCNKLTCICGYSMCYLCRKGLGPGAERVRQLQQRIQQCANPGEDDDPEEENPEGYRHFCEHFRLTPGTKCKDCNKCELYKMEDEEAIVRRAGEKAERAWHKRQGGAVGVGLLEVNHDFSTAGERKSRHPFENRDMFYHLGEMWSDGHFKIEGQAIMDWMVEVTVALED